MAFDPRGALEGTPYLFSDDCDIRTEIDKLTGAQADISRRLTVVIKNLQSRGLLRDIRTQTRSREVFETNALEGVGPNFRTTVDILKSKPAEIALQRVREGMLLDSITAERKILDVIGMNAAKDLASRLASSSDYRGITESEIRSFHAIISAQEIFAGKYRTGHVEIHKAKHKPPHPIEVPRLMADMVTWSNNSLDITPPILRAAVLHAWLTHIHPFDDGNGRTARLLVNMLMTQSGLPPVIVRHNADRGTYLDALALSDVAGDILPFCGVFITALKRHIRQVEKPQFMRQLFIDEMKARGSSLFDAWKSATAAFIEQLTSALFTYRLKVEKVGDIDRTSFELLRGGDREGNVWFLKISDGAGRELLVWYGYSSYETARLIPWKGHMPSMYFSVRNDGQQMIPYRRVTDYELDGLHELLIVPEVPARVYALFNTLKSGQIADSADYIAETISRSFSKGEIPLIRTTGI
ncbi:Fic family protein [Amycolatopsis sp. NPDC004625]|uniref:Fic family protein n=1 Tax=Amycolatopsis sp. NPDC004625 TaxID=3154670 RepID=UPI0033B2D183